MTALLVDLVLLVLALEAALLCVRHARTGRGPSPRELAGLLGAGLFLTLAVRFAVAGLSLPWIGCSLALAGLAHLADLRRRL